MAKLLFFLNKMSFCCQYFLSLQKIFFKMQERFIKYISFTLFLIAAVSSCTDKERQTIVKQNQADSLINAAYKQYDYERLLQLADQLDSTNEISEMKANYWRGYAYSRERKMHLAENYWQKAISLDIKNREDLEYYSKSANRLASVLLLRGEYESTMKVAVPAMNKLVEKGYDSNCDFAYLLLSVGCCQLKLNTSNEAAKSFQDAYSKYLEVIKYEPSSSNVTSAVVGVITIADNYLFQHYYQEAYDWTSHLEELLHEYSNLPDPNQSYLDKQTARLYLYRAWAMEGLGNKADAKLNYEKALLTDYANTGDGKLEAINYLTSAGRWVDAARNYESLDAQMNKFNIHPTVENIQRYYLPKYRANINANRLDTANAVASAICERLDSSIISMQRDEALEMATIYNTQQKETEIMQQKADMERQQFLAAIVLMVLVLFGFSLFIFFRHKAAMRLEIAYKKLEEANERTKESSRMKTSFIQQISHEIRTPLNILSGFTQVITTSNADLDEDTRKDINKQILENTNRITELVNKMLELSDANSKTVIERNDDVLALQIAAQAASNFPPCEEYKIPIELEVGEGSDTLMLHTNEQAATRAIVLMLDNAERFTKEGTIRLKVEKLEGKVQFVIEDTGIGIPANEAEHIFEEFVQLNEYEIGTGIGLTVARSFCRRLGGDIVLDTSYTAGARFLMTLPLSEASS